MGNACTHLIIGRWVIDVNWDAWSAIGTVLAVVVALILPQYTAMKEWARQDRLRELDLARTKKATTSVIHEVCSTVDRIVAYRKSAMALFAADNVYHLGFQAMERIHENAKTLLEMLELLKGRSELTDGALYVAVSGRRLAEAVIAQTVPPDPTTGANWISRNHALALFDQLSEMVEARTIKVRRSANLKEESDSAALILAKYTNIADAITASRAADSGAPDLQATNEYY